MVSFLDTQSDIDWLETAIEETVSARRDFRGRRACMPASSHNAGRRGIRRSQGRRRPNGGRSVHNGMFRRCRHLC